jgi:serine/threonine protein kinase
MPMKDFKIAGSLGKGAFAAVTKVTRISDGKTYALKRVNISKMKQSEIEDTLNEVRKNEEFIF